MQDFGESVSLAYVMIAPRLDLPHGTPEWEPLTSGHGNLRRWLDRMNARPSMVSTTWERGQHRQRRLAAKQIIGARHS